MNVLTAQAESRQRRSGAAKGELLLLLPEGLRIATQQQPKQQAQVERC